MTGRVEGDLRPSLSCQLLLMHQIRKLNQKCPVCEHNSGLWNSGIDSNKEVDTLIRTVLKKDFIIDKKDKKFRHHIINPKTGRSATGFDSVTVIHRDPYIADATATALLIAGKKDYSKIAVSMGVDKFILIDTMGIVTISPNIKKRILKNK